MAGDYVHGYDAAAGIRLTDQANALAALLHDGTEYRAGDRVLEAGCGVGSQTQILAARSPATAFTSIDINEASLAEARRHCGHLANVTFRQADITELPFEDGAFDHAFLCFVLEHMADPLRALREVTRTLRPGGSITVIEGDHGSVLMHPESTAARDAISCQVALQREAGGDALIGRRLYPLMAATGLVEVRVEPRQVYTDGGHRDLADAFTRRTFTAMIEGVRDMALSRRLIDAARFDQGIEALLQTTQTDGTFAYTFFKGVGRRPAASLQTGPLVHD